jgi:putative FmdB family regulatory protein
MCGGSIPPVPRKNYRKEFMPTYQFTCGDCGDILLQSFSFDMEARVNCGHCGSIMRKEFTPPAIHFKGDGWAGKS